MTFDEFMASKERNLYVKERGFSGLYVRKGPRVIRLPDQDSFVCPKTIQIANVTVSEKRRGKGLFKALVKNILDKYPEWSIYVENVLPKRFAAGLSRLGFIEVNQAEGGGSVTNWIINLPKS